MHAAGRHDASEPYAEYPPRSRRGEPVEIPAALAEPRPDLGHYEYVILGAGCAGLSLCYYLLKLGVTAPILILDGKPGFEDDRTWCFWDVEPTPFSHLAIGHWHSWTIAAGERSLTQTSSSYPYLCLTARDFYEHVLEEISKHPNVTLRLGERVENRQELDGQVRITSVRRTYTASRVLDGRGLPPGAPEFEKARRESAWVPQRFLGLRIRTARPVFDAEACTLMDFRVSQKKGLRFVYVLPFGEREALVENVYLAEGQTSPKEHRAEIQSYLQTRFGLAADEYVIDGEEQGFIPMTDHHFPRRLGDLTHAIGMLGGESRPSTGYTFVRIQRYCRALAKALVRGESPPERPESRRFEALDAIFLRFMQQHPERCPQIYARMFAGVLPGPLVRFLTETSTPDDELRLIMALPKMPFLKIAGRLVLGGRHAAG